MSYIIKNDKIIAKTEAEFTSGATVQYAYFACNEEISTGREKNLVNKRTGKISNAAKWDRAWSKIEAEERAIEVNPGEFLIG